MNAYTACILGPYGSAIYLNVMAADMEHARELAREHGAGLFGKREFSFTVRKA